MDTTDVIAVVGTCAPERRLYSVALAESARRLPLSAGRLAMAFDPVAETRALASWADAPGVVAEFPSSVPVTEIIGELADPDSPIRLSGVRCVVDAAHLVGDLGRDDYLVRRMPQGGKEFRARALATVTQIEHASTAVLVNWESLPTEDLSLVLALVSALNPAARLRLHPAPFPTPDAPEDISPVRTGAGWIALLNDSFTPHMTHPRIEGMRDEGMRPFHPERLLALLDTIEAGRFGTVVRSSGFCRLSTRSATTAHWEHVGSMLSLHPLATDAARGDDEVLAFGHDLAVIGLDLDTAGLRLALREAALSDDELAAGPAAWQHHHDPFPEWTPAVTE